MRSTVVCIVQARMGSSRLPGKSMMKILGKPMIWHVLNRVKQCKSIGSIVLAIPQEIGNGPLSQLGLDIGIPVLEGQHYDVLDRYYRAANLPMFATTTVIRITGDCPLIDPDIIEACLDFYKIQHENNGVEYVSNVGSYPEGLDVEVFSKNALDSAWREAQTQYMREHVTPYIASHMKSKIFPWAGRHPDPGKYHFSVDTKEDFIHISKIFDELFEMDDTFRLKDILRVEEKLRDNGTL